jgi:uncharacterized protein with HEPN domain
MKDDALYLAHIRECIERITEYTKKSHAVLVEDRMVQDAVLRNLHTLSESTTRLSDACKQRHTGIDWRKIAGFRNVIVHDYLGVDLDIVWGIVEQDLPVLHRTVTAMLAELGVP